MAVTSILSCAICPLFARMSSSRKLEVHNVLYRHHNRTKPRPCVTCVENSLKYGYAVLAASRGVSGSLDLLRGIVVYLALPNYSSAKFNGLLLDNGSSCTQRHGYYRIRVLFIIIIIITVASLYHRVHGRQHASEVSCGMDEIVSELEIY